MSKPSEPGLNLFLQILVKLEQLQIPYAIIGGFAAAMYGITRATVDIDILVEMQSAHIDALAQAFPLPRYYADPEQMRRATDLGSSFNIIDSELGAKADLFPVSMDERYRPAFSNRIRRPIDIPGLPVDEVWAARPEDVIVGKLMAWEEGRSQRQAADIYEMMLFHYLGGDSNMAFDIDYVSTRADAISQEAAELWSFIKTTAQEASQGNV